MALKDFFNRSSLIALGIGVAVGILYTFYNDQQLEKQAISHVQNLLTQLTTKPELKETDLKQFFENNLHKKILSTLKPLGTINYYYIETGDAAYGLHKHHGWLRAAEITTYIGFANKQRTRVVFALSHHNNKWLIRKMSIYPGHADENALPELVLG